MLSFRLDLGIADEVIKYADAKVSYLNSSIRAPENVLKLLCRLM